MITVTTTVFKKATLALIGLACAAGIIFSVGLSHQNDTEVRAATSETKRVWMKNSITSTWDADGAATYIHYWGGSSGTTFPGVPVLWDSANSLVYYDLPADVPAFQFTRCSSGGAYWDAKTADLSYSNSVGKYYDLTGPIAWGGATTPGSFVAFTPVTTKVVSDFAATIDTSGEACNKPSAQTAVNSYNALSTFEQDQFDVLSVGEGFTGLQRLNFLKTFFGIETPLNINNIGNGNGSDDSMMTMLIIGAVGLTALGGYYVISRKKHLA